MKPTKARKKNPADQSALKSPPLPPVGIQNPAPQVRPWLIGLLLFVITFTVYVPSAGYDFTNLDDPEYIMDNPQVTAGLTWAGVKWAFAAPRVGNWIPLAWLTHMLDVQIFGLDAGGPHLVNALIHALNGVLVFWFLKKMTGALWPAALVAGLFALHPLRVESVAWVCERRDVLSSFFALFALVAYAHYAEVSRQKNPRAKWFYGLTLLAFVLGLMSKAMIVTLPFLLLLLDYWPLQRDFSFKFHWGRRASSFQFPVYGLDRLLLEKLPFFALSVIFGVLTVRGQKELGAMPSFTTLPMSVRIGSAFVSYARYLAKTFWPLNLTVPYPYVGRWPGSLMALSFVLVVGLSVWAACSLRRRPYVFTGWFWFLGGLFPVIGLLQTGNQSVADRFTYLPSIGLFILLVWGTGECLRRWLAGRWIQTALAAVLLAACAWRSRDQLRYWQDSDTLFHHAIQVTHKNFIAYYNLACYLRDTDRLAEATQLFRAGLQFSPDDPGLLAGLAYALGNLQGQYAQAAELYQAALLRAQDKPNNWYIHNNYAGLLSRMDPTNAPEMINQYREAARLRPDFEPVCVTLGLALAKSGKLAEATGYLQTAVRLKPDSPEDHCNLGNALALQDRNDQAIQQYQEALRLRPGYAHAENNLASAFEAVGRLDDALAQYQAALRQEPDSTITRCNLGDLLVKMGRRDEAVAQFKEALRLQSDNAGAKEQLEKLTAPASP
jgi:tetratricopeptide (TPR) repeat protein